jgi:hypothetical protein
VFCSVGWSKSSGERDQLGAVDIVVVNQAGDELLMEMKSGRMVLRPEDIFKAYCARSEDVRVQALLSRLRSDGRQDST